MKMTDRILFVDDDEPVRRAFKRSLRAENMEIDLASSPTEALELAEANDYAVFVVDYRMPGRDGLDLVDELKAKCPDATFVLLSGELDLALSVDAVNEHGVNFVLSKPWTGDGLATVVRRAVEACWERHLARRIQQQVAGDLAASMW